MGSRAVQKAELRRAEEAATRPAITRCAFTPGCAGMCILLVLSTASDFQQSYIAGIKSATQPPPAAFIARSTSCSEETSPYDVISKGITHWSGARHIMELN